MIQSQIQASQTSSMVATSPRDGRHHSQDPLAKFLKQSPAAIDFVQTVCFDADDYDNGSFLDSLVDHASAIYIPISQQGGRGTRRFSKSYHHLSRVLREVTIT
jgi:hypothetical protein